MPNRTYRRIPNVAIIRDILWKVAATQQALHEHLLNVEYRYCSKGRAPFCALYYVQPRLVLSNKKTDLARIDLVLYDAKPDICLRTFELSIKIMAHQIIEGIHNSTLSKPNLEIRIY